MTTDASTDVLIIGGGPTGHCLAADLARRGVACRIVEQSTVRRSAPKAINVHPRSLEVFADLGIVEEAIELGNKVRRLNTYSVGEAPRRISQVDFTRLRTRFPFTLTLPQPVTDRLLQERAAKDGVVEELGIRFLGLTQDEDCVIAHLEHVESGQQERVRTRYLVGCDGINSRVRDALGFTFDGKQYDNDLACADVIADWDRPHDEAHNFLSDVGTLRCMPMPGSGRWRLVADVGMLRNERGETLKGEEDEYSQPVRSSADALQRPQRDQVDIAELQKLVSSRGAEARLVETGWFSRFNIYQHFAPHYRLGRVFLAGDAAHVHSPLGAQGMNLGLQDAYSLGWRLAQVVQGISGPQLLVAYGEERRGVAANILESTDRNTRLISLHSPLARKFRDYGLKQVTRMPAFAERQRNRGAMLSINYRDSRWVREDASSGLLERFRRAPAPGDRAPDAEFGAPGRRGRIHELLYGTEHVLLLFAGTAGHNGSQLFEIARDVSERYRPHVRIHVVCRASAAARVNDSELVVADPQGEFHRSWHADAGHLYLIRPDQHIGYRAVPADAARLCSYLDSVFAQAGDRR